ncbi:MAG TPA: MFS transporter [Gaiellaceae bacterium]|nr:MFS transporter [Gaiellaceae bacterium]
MIPDVLREREFRLLWSGQTVSVIGDGILLLALSFAVLDLTGSATDVGIVIAASRAPLVLTVLAGGVVADRVSRRWLMVGADLVRMTGLAASAALLIAGTAQLWELVVLQAIVGTAAGFFYPASTGLLPIVVRPELLQQANGFRGISDGIARIVGPVVAGLIVVLASPGWALAVDAATFAVSAASLVLLRLPPHERRPPRRFLHDLADGWREFSSRTWVWATVVFAGGLGNLFSAFIGVLAPEIAKNELGGAGVYSLIVAAQGAGGLVGAFVVLRLRVRRPVVASTLFWALLVFPNLLLGFVAPAWVIAAGFLVGGIGLSAGQAFWDTALQRHIPITALSRVSSYDWFGSLIFNPLGFVIAGPLAAAIGARATLSIAAFYFVASSAILISIPAVRAVRDE